MLPAFLAENILLYVKIHDNLYYIALKQRRAKVIWVRIYSQNNDNYFDEFAAMRLRYHKKLRRVFS